MNKSYLNKLLFDYEYNFFRNKLFIKLSLIFWNGLQRIFFLLSGMIGGILLAQIIREKFIFNYLGLLKILVYVFIEIAAILIYNYRNKFKKKSENLWKDIDKNINKNEQMKMMENSPNLFNLIKNIDNSEITIYSNLIIILFIGSFILFFLNSFFLLVLFWISIMFLLIYSLNFVKKSLIHNKKSIQINSKKNILFRYFYNLFLIKKKGFTTIQIKLLIMPFTILTLILSIYLFLPKTNIDVSKLIILFITIRQVLASMRIITLTSMLKDK